VYISSRERVSELRSVTCRMESHSVNALSATGERAQPGWYSIYLPRRDERLSWSVKAALKAELTVVISVLFSRCWPLSMMRIFIVTFCLR